MKKSLAVSIRIMDLPSFKGKFQHLPSNETFELMIDYPLKDYALFKIRTGKSGMDLNSLLLKIGKAYEEIYQDVDKYGVYGHCIGDLHLEGIDIDYLKKKITLFVGS